MDNKLKGIKLLLSISVLLGFCFPTFCQSSGYFTQSIERNNEIHEEYCYFQDTVLAIKIIQQRDSCFYTYPSLLSNIVICKNKKTIITKDSDGYIIKEDEYKREDSTIEFYITCSRTFRRNNKNELIKKEKYIYENGIEQFDHSWGYTYDDISGYLLQKSYLASNGFSKQYDYQYYNNGQLYFIFLSSSTPESDFSAFDTTEFKYNFNGSIQSKSTIHSNENFTSYEDSVIYKYNSLYSERWKKTKIKDSSEFVFNTYSRLTFSPSRFIEFSSIEHRTLNKSGSYTKKHTITQFSVDTSLINQGVYSKDQHYTSYNEDGTNVNEVLLTYNYSDELHLNHCLDQLKNDKNTPIIFPSPSFAGQPILVFLNGIKCDEYVIYNNLGQVVQTASIPSGKDLLQINNIMTAGIYYIQLSSNKKLEGKASSFVVLQ